MTDSLSIAIHAFVNRVSMSFSVDETLLPRYVNLSTSFREVPSSVGKMWPASSHVLEFILQPISLLDITR